MKALHPFIDVLTIKEKKGFKMEIVQKARGFYVKKFTEKDQNTMKSVNDDDIDSFVSIALKSINSVHELFSNQSVFTVLVEALHVCVSSNMDVLSLALAFRCLERYFILVVSQPWKPEFKTLKTYGGYYKTNVKSVLQNAEVIFHDAGYQIDHSTMVYLPYAVDETKFLILAFECFVASKICNKINEKHTELKKVGGQLNDAVFDIIKVSIPKIIPEEVSINNHFQKMSVSSHANSITPDKLLNNSALGNRGVMPNGRVNRASKTVIYSQEPAPLFDANVRGRHPEELVNFKYKSNQDQHIPFIDDEAEHHTQLSEATPEEHMRESFKLVTKQSQPLSDSMRYNNPGIASSSSNPASVSTYPPGFQNSNPQRYPWKPMPCKEYFKDEGIDLDLAFQPTHSPASSALSNYNVMTSNNPGSVYTDSDYATGFVNPDPNLRSSSLSQNQHSSEIMSDTIYHPPNTNVVLIDTSQNTMSSNSSVPPPVPSRHLKPSFSSYPKPIINKQNQDFQVPNQVVGIPPIKAVHSQSPGFSMDGKKHQSNRSLLQVKSNSLKSDSKKLSSDNNRMAKSMDYTRWLCNICTVWNSASNQVCHSCSTNSGKGLSTNVDVPDGLPVKSCPVCTFDNDFNASACAMCYRSLTGEVNFVPFPSFK